MWCSCKYSCVDCHLKSHHSNYCFNLSLSVEPFSSKTILCQYVHSPAVSQAKPVFNQGSQLDDIYDKFALSLKILCKLR